MSFITRGFTGRSRDHDPRLPPGQTRVEDWPVLSAGPTPNIATSDWAFTITTEDGTVHHDELHGPTAESPSGQWLYRHWQHSGGNDAYYARRLAFACARAGLWLGAGRAVSGPRA